MPTLLRPARSAALFTSLVAAAALGCSKEGPAPLTCDTDESCPPASRCVQRACVADAPPLAHVASIEGVVANDLAVLDGSRSSDPDAPRDGVVSYEWTVKAVDAPCDPPVVAGTTARPQVRFACPGHYEVSLVVTDELSVRSAPASITLEVAPRSGEPLVTIGPDLAVDHRCAGEPLVCRPLTELDGAIALSAASAVEGVAFRWTVEPPEGRALDATRRVTFDAGAETAEALVRIETDGTAISGDWVFRVEARDAAGVVGSAAVRVSIANAPPVVTETVPLFHHTFDAPSSRFSALGAIGVVASDPDGDPIEGRTVSAHHTGDGSATFEVADLGDRIAFSVELPYAQPDDALFLIGGEGLERAITFAIRDMNGSGTSETWPVVIANTPPELVTPVPNLSVNHTYSAGAYRASAVLSRWRDPDGDPLFPGDGTGDAACSSYEIDASGRVVVACMLPSPVAAVAGNFVGPHDVQQRVRDSWSSSPVATVTRLDVLNRPPAVANLHEMVYGDCLPTTSCCDLECTDYKIKLLATSATIGGFASDPDGDPLAVTVLGSTTACLPSDCSFPMSFVSSTNCNGSTKHYPTVTATDGVATATGQMEVTRTCAL